MPLLSFSFYLLSALALGMARIILTGATGMVGEGVLHECLQHPDVEKILIVNRKPAGINVFFNPLVGLINPGRKLYAFLKGSFIRSFSVFPFIRAHIDRPFSVLSVWAPEI